MAFRTLLLATLLAMTLSAKNLVIGTENLPFMPYYNEDSTQGYAVEFFQAFARKYNHEIELTPLPVKRLFKLFLNNKVDIKFPDNAMWQKDLREEKEIVYSKPIITAHGGLARLKENEGKPDADIKSLGVIQGFTPFAFMDKGWQIKENKSVKGLMLQLQKKRIDVLYIDKNALLYNMKEYNIDGLVFDTSLTNFKDEYHASSINHPDVMKEIDAFMESEKAFIEELKKKYKL